METRWSCSDDPNATSRPPDPLLHDNPYRPPLPYRVVFALARYLVRMLFRFRVDGLENLPPPPFLIASNHQAWYDTIFIVAALPRLPMIYTMARRDTVFNRRWKRWLVPLFGVFPIQPQEGELDERGVASVYQVLQRGGAVLIFPEGRYSRGRELRPLKRGIAHFALQAGVPIVPVAISGLDRLRLFGRVEIYIGPPIRPRPPLGVGSEACTWEFSSLVCGGFGRPLPCTNQPLSQIRGAYHQSGEDSRNRCRRRQGRDSFA